MDFEPVNITPRNTNSLIVREGKKTYAFDPWGTPEQWKGRGVSTVFVTHGHFDHVSALVGWDVSWYMDLNDRPALDWSSMFLPGTPTRAPRDLSDAPPVGDMQIIKTPGHTAGGVCFYFPSAKILLSGDTLFYDTIGRTDLPHSDHAKMLESIQALKNYGFAEDVMVIPGHGRHGYWGDVLRGNPFLK